MVNVLNCFSPCYFKFFFLPSSHCNGQFVWCLWIFFQPLCCKCLPILLSHHQHLFHPKGCTIFSLLFSWDSLILSLIPCGNFWHAPTSPFTPIWCLLALVISPLVVFKKKPFLLLMSFKEYYSQAISRLSPVGFTKTEPVDTVVHKLHLAAGLTP